MSKTNLQTFDSENADGNSSLAHYTLKEDQSDRDGSDEKDERLHQAQKLEAIGILSGGVAHDFNNLLTAILGHAQLAMLKLDDNDPLKVRLKEIEKAGNRAASLTRQLLAFSRRQHLQRRKILLNETVADILKLIDRIIGEDVSIRTSFAPDLQHINADPGQIEQVIMNLCVNARDAMPEGGEIIIEINNVVLAPGYFSGERNNRQPSSFVQIKVTDTGVGIDSQTIKRIFEPFFTTKEVGKGTGLGLSMVYGIVKQHEGHIEVESKVNSGTTFSIYLPTCQGKKKHSEQVNANQPWLFRGTETILVAEDEASIRELIREILESLGYKVLMAKDGEEAFEIFESNSASIDLLLFDVVMPRGGGPTALKRIQTIRRDVPVVFMTGYSYENARNQVTKQKSLIKDLEAIVIQKPYDLEAVSRKIREVLDTRRAL